MRLIIAGSRDFNDYQLLCDKLKELEIIPNTVTIISGGARGADKLGERWAKEHGAALEVHPAKWNVYGKSAGYRRNVEMAKVATHLCAFWDGRSRGTQHMIKIANAYGLRVCVINFTIDYPLEKPIERKGVFPRSTE